MASMSPKERSAFGKQAAESRWAKRHALERLVERVYAAQARLQPLLPEIDPHDLGMILERRFRSWGSGQRFFIRPKQGGGYVF